MIAMARKRTEETLPFIPTLGAAIRAVCGNRRTSREQSKNTAQGSSEMMPGEGMHMMEGNKMPMMDMMQEMHSMMKKCNEMMEKHEHE